MSDPRQERMDSLRDEIRTCTRCEGMNIAKVTQAAPGWGSVRSPVVIVGQSLCRRCMATQIPFTGGSGRILEDSFKKAGIAKDKLFITNVVHCHPPENHPTSLPEWKGNCTPYLHCELQIVQPRLVIGLGDDAEVAVRSAYPGVKSLPWPFTVPATRSKATSTPALLFAPHPRRMQFQPQHRKQYVTGLADALKWGFRI